MNKDITISIQSSNVVDFEAKKKALQSIALLDTDTIAKLGELATSEKAVQKLKSNWFLIKNMVM